MSKDRIVTGAETFAERKVVELMAMGEEAVIEKRRRVVEEVSIRKVGTSSVEQIRDSVRRTEVDVQDVSETGSL